LDRRLLEPVNLDFEPADCGFQFFHTLVCRDQALAKTLVKGHVL
jgi:hypothetical protein